MIAVVYIGNRVTRKFREAHQLSGNNFICKIFTLDDKVRVSCLKQLVFINKLKPCPAVLENFIMQVLDNTFLTS